MPPLRRQSEDDPALQHMEQAMKDLAHPSSEDHLSESIKARQRAELLSLASSMPLSSSGANAAPQPSSAHPQRKRIFLYAAGFAVAVLVLNLVISSLPNRRDDGRGSVISRLLVPAAQSAQAFSLTPIKSTAGGMDPDQGWTLKTSVPASAEAIQRAIAIEPKVAIRVEKIDDQSWRITPDGKLNQNTLYRVKLATALQNGVIETPYEYSWVNQTAGAFQVESLTPGPGATYVPLDTGIEWTFSQAGFSNATSSIQISPAVAGRFETRDRTLVFLPEKPLKPGQIYRVRLSSGFGITDTPGMQLKKDMEYAFQTAQEMTSSVISEFYLPIEQEVATGKMIQLPFANTSEKPLASARIEAFALNATEVEAYLRLRSMQYGSFMWNDSGKSSLDALIKGKKATFVLDQVKPQSAAGDVNGPQLYLPIPQQKAGFYFLRVSAKGYATDLSLVQVSDIAVNAITDSASGLMWVVNAKTRQPISGATVRIGDVSATTAADGLAKLALPEEMTTPSKLEAKVLMARVQADGQETVVKIDPQVAPWWFGGGPTGDAFEGLRRTWSYLYVDRLIQRQADTINIFGLALDRGSKQPASNLKLSIRPNDFYFNRGGMLLTPTLDEQNLVPDAFGRFQASFAWKNRKVGSYTINLLRDGRVVDSQWFSVKEDAKPRMAISLSMDRNELIAGDVLMGKVYTTFVDGTTFPNADVRVQITQSTGQIFDQVLRTDDRGEASIRVQTNRSGGCVPSASGSYFEGDCYGTGSAEVRAYSVTGEDSQVSAYASVTLHASSLQVTGADANYQTPQLVWTSDNTASLTARIHRLTLTATGTQSTPVADQSLNVDIYRVNVNEMQTGTIYDEVEKRVRPVMTQVRTLAVESRLFAVSDMNGLVRLDLPFQSTSSEYQVLAMLSDSQGRRSTVQLWTPYRAPRVTAGTGPSGSGVGAEIAQPDRFTLVRSDQATNENQDWRKLNINQRVKVTVQVNEQPLSLQKYSQPLFVLASRGIVLATVSAKDSLEFTFDEKVYPNVTVYAVVMTDDGFKRMSNEFYLNTDPFVLTVQATTDKESYLPGEKALVNIRVLDNQGKVAQGARVVLSTADLALTSLGAFVTYGKPVDVLYRGVENGIVALVSTHEKVSAFNGGAEGGGGGEGDVLFEPRKNFKDQADFQVVETDASGEAKVTFTLPDNITTWRLETIALSKDLQVGNIVLERPATKPLAVDAVIPRVLQIGDQAQLKLRPIAKNLADTMEVTYAVNAPELGIDHQTFKTKGRANVYVPITITDKMIGMHTVQVGVLTKDHQDAMEFSVRVEERGYTKTIWEQARATDGFKLPDNLAPESMVIISSSGRSGLLSEVQNFMVGQATTRLESLVAARMAASLLPLVGAPTSTDSVPAINWSSYQANGLKPLPQSGENLETSFSIALSGETSVDRGALIQYFRAIAQAKESSRETRLKAVGGLGMLGEPVLPSLQAALSHTDLTWKEQAILIKTFVAMGDREHVKTIFDQWMTKSQEVDGRTFINVDASDAQRFEATRVAVLAAGFLSDERFGKLNEYISKSSLAQPPFDPILSAKILQLRVAQAPNEEAKITYRIGDKTSEVDLKNWPVWIPLSGTTWSMFSIDKVQGPVTVQWSRRVSGAPEQTDRLSIKRTYTPVKVGQMREGDSVRVTLTPTMTNRETFACYEIRDRLPANLRPILDWQFTDQAWSPATQGDGEMRFTTCNSYQDPISYIAQIVSPGQYLAPAPILQNIDQPSLAAIGKEDTVVSTKR